MDDRKLIYNAVECLNCGEILVSYNTHDYKTCSCENSTMCDGGLSYQRYGGKDMSLVKPMPIYDDCSHEIIREHLSRGSRGKDSTEELKYILLKDIDYLDELIEYEEQHRPNNPYLKHYKNEREYRNKI